MKPFSTLAAIAVTFGAARTAGATCDQCCEQLATLAGWSTDGNTVAVIQTFENGERVLSVTSPAGDRSWASFGADQPECVGELEALPGSLRFDARRIDVRRWRPLRGHALEPVDDAWRTAFADAFTIVPVGKRTFWRDRFGLGVTRHDACTAWELRDAAGDVVARLPRDCDDAIPLGRLEIRGGYLQPGGTVALVKVRIHRVRLVTEERFLRVELP